MLQWLIIRINNSLQIILSIFPIYDLCKYSRSFFMTGMIDKKFMLFCVSYQKRIYSQFVQRFIVVHSSCIKLAMLKVTKKNCSSGKKFVKEALECAAMPLIIWLQNFKKFWCKSNFAKRCLKTQSITYNVSYNVGE